MKKILALLSLALLIIGCAPAAKSMSNFNQVYPLKGESVVVATNAHKDYIDFANEVSDSVSANLNARSVSAITYKASANGLELSNNPVMDFAKENNAKYILSQTFTTLKIYNAALEQYDEEMALYSVEEQKIVWKGTTTWNNPMPMGLGAGIRASKDEVIRLLTTDGFLEAVPAQQ